MSVDEDSLTLADTVQAALDLWVEVTGKAMDTTRFSFGDWDLYGMHNELTETLKLDPSGVTTYLLLECFLREYLEKRTFTVASIMKDFERLTAYLAQAERLFSMVQSDAVTERMAVFRSRVIEGVKRYGADREDVIALINSQNVLPFLRRDALRSLETLNAFQFLSGEPDHARPQVIHAVYQAWDINDLLIAVRDLPVSGVALVLLRDPARTDRSYFTFAMRNGQNVIIFTDKMQYSNPLQADMTRRPDRDFQRREWQNHFPYQLLKFHIDEDDNLIFDKEKGLVIPNQKLVPVAQIADLPPAQVVWVSMMLSLIADRFWHKGWRAPVLSYTAGMIKVRDKLVVDASGERLPIGVGYQPITMDLLEVDEVTRDAMVDQTGEATSVNSWIEDRYRSTVTKEVINQWVPETGKALKLSGPRESTSVKVVREDEVHSIFRSDKVYELRGLNPTEFGTEEALRKDQLWLARYNMAQQLQKAADEEYEARKNEVIAWFKERVATNLPALLQAIGAGRLDSEGVDSYGFSRLHKRKMVQILRFEELSEMNYTFPTVVLGAFDRSAGAHPQRCVLTSAAATYRARFTPESAHGLALLAGRGVEELPDVLQHWTYEKPYTGNSILDRIDPVEAYIHNPWMKTNFVVMVFLSKRGYARVLKEAAGSVG